MKRRKIYCILSALLAMSGSGINASELQSSKTLKERVLNNQKSGINKRSKSSDVVAPFVWVSAAGVISKIAIDSWKEKMKNSKEVTIYTQPNLPTHGDPHGDPHDDPHGDPQPLPKTAGNVTEVVTYNGDLEFSPVQGAGSCFLSALCSIWYNPKSAKENVYEKYSNKSIQDIDQEIKKHFRHLQEKYGKIYYNDRRVHLDTPTDLEYMKKNNASINLDSAGTKTKKINDATKEEINNYIKMVEDEYDFKKKLMYASIINRSKFYNEGYNKVKDNKSGRDVFMSFRDYNDFGIKKENVEVGSNIYTLNKDVEGHTDPAEKDKVINEQLFCGTWYGQGKIVGVDGNNKMIYEYPRSGNDGDATEILSQDEQLGSVGFECTHNPNTARGNQLLEPDAMYVSYGAYNRNVVIDDNFKKINISEKPKQLKKLPNGNFETDDDGDVKWDNQEYQIWTDISENGEIYEPISKKEYVLVAIETVNGAHCNAQKLKFYKNDDNSITLAGWLHHECILQSWAQLHLVKNSEKLTAQQILKFRDECTGTSEKSGLILKFVPKQDILDYPEYYCVNQYKK